MMTLGNKNFDDNDTDGSNSESHTETVALLSPSTPTQILPPTPTLGLPLIASNWSNPVTSSTLRPSNSVETLSAKPQNPALRTRKSSAGSIHQPRPVHHHSPHHHHHHHSHKHHGRKVIRWIGVNGDEQDSSEGSFHHHGSGSAPITPHIIVSPDVDDDLSPPEFPISNDDRIASIQRIETRKNAADDKTFRTIENAEMSESPNYLRSLTPEQDKIESLKVDAETSNREVTGHRNTPQKSDTPNTSKSSHKSIKLYSLLPIQRSVETTPSDDSPPSFFPNPEGPVDDSQISEHQQKSSVLLQQRHDNNMSMANLDPMDPLMRKTRRNSMIGMMRRVSSTGNLGLQGLVPSHVTRSTSRFSLNPPSTDYRLEMNASDHLLSSETLIMYISALYGKLLVVMGMAFPLAKIISNDVPSILYNSFYLYLYFGSILFLIYAYIFILRSKPLATDLIRYKFKSLKRRIPSIQVNWSKVPLPERMKNYFINRNAEKAEGDEGYSANTSTYKPPKYTITETNNHGSMYLKMGAVIFGIGSMIYSGLEFGQYFELYNIPECANILMAVTPIARMIFTFLQMYFIFLNSRMAITKHTILARFGLMHMLGTNFCIWISVLVQETKHEIDHLMHKQNRSIDMITGSDHDTSSEEISDIEPILDKIYGDANIHHISRRDAVDAEDIFKCRRINILGHVVSSASPFLFPCTIEFSLLCAGVLYVMWKNTKINRFEKSMADGDSDASTYIARKIRHHYSVDCARASRGLFMGIFILVLTIISLILFQVLVSNEQFMKFAILEANIVELSIYSMAIISVIYGMKQMRELEFISDGDIELDNILLVVAQAGVYIYTSFTIIGGYFNMNESRALPMVTAVITLIQTTLQTLLILDGSRRFCYTTDQLDRKPGRETITFLLVCNLAMWAISTFETSRADIHPVQLHFYGIWAWTIISHVSMPLAIFYRFHVTVCLGEIWKRTYKMKNTFIGL